MHRQTFFSILLGVFLIAPLIFTTLSQRLEPYPAILLPAGAWTVPITDEISFFHKAIYARREAGGEWIAIDSRRFLDPIPVWYLNGLISHRFGLEPTAGHAKIIDVRGTKEWLRDRLGALGFDKGAFRAEVTIMTLDRETKKERARKIVYEKIYVLD